MRRSQHRSGAISTKIAPLCVPVSPLRRPRKRHLERIIRELFILDGLELGRAQADILGVEDLTLERLQVVQGGRGFGHFRRP